MTAYTSSVSHTAFPPTFINQYVVKQLETFNILAGTEQMVPIFATIPTKIAEVFDNYIGAPGVQSPLLIQFERLVRYRPNRMYKIRREQLVYYLYCDDLSKLIDSNRVITDALDREDASAQDINKYCKSVATTDKPLNVFFHSTRVYQIDESRDILELSSARTVSANKIIIEYDYHTNDPANYPYT